MGEFIMCGKATLTGVVFFITADNIEHAHEKAKAGQFDSYETDNVELIDWDIAKKTIQANDDSNQKFK